MSCMEVSLHYGREQMKLYLPSENLAGWIRPRPMADAHPQDSLVNLSARPQARQFVQQIQGKRLCVLLPDGTRDFPWNAVLPPVFGLLKGAEQLSFLICTGTHTAQTPENKAILEKIVQLVRQAGIFSYETVLHDCQTSRMSDAGRTKYGTPILYNAVLDNADVFLVFSDVKFHYFAGYSNPVKNFVPGACAFQTAQVNHSLTFDSRSISGAHPWHPNPARRLQPLAADQLEAMEKIVRGRAVWAVVTISDKSKLYWARFGPAQEVTPQAFFAVDEHTEYTLPRVERMVISCGGHPDDSDLYIAQRALELTHRVVLDGGQILFLAACTNGICPQIAYRDFYLKLTEPIEQILREKPAQYKLYSHKPYRFAQLLRRLSRFYIYTQLEEPLVKKIHLTAVKNPQSLVNEWIEENPLVKILFVDGANKLAIRPKTEKQGSTAE
ncbi:MAG TPA: lactate racemase domain-containing protein [Anaerohalosphaeraceae bacterium]|nr:lactate racemase domain-containing protein [Anaerohalosphaeraceae bacterium]